MDNDDDGAWFAPKRLGYGAGRPIAWQGWAVLLALATGLWLDHRYLHGPARWLTMLGLLVLFTTICVAKTRGGWTWRSGRNPD